MRTTYHDSDGWPRPLRAPQHAAAPFGPSAPTRLQAQRALRLFATAGLWAAGLCLVIGAIVLVVAQARPDRLAPLSATRPNRIGRIGANAASPVAGRPGRTNPVRGKAHPPAVRQLAAFSGHGDKTTRTFRTAASTSWQVRWSYTCGSAVRAGLFVVEDAGRRAVGASITESGEAGHGITSLLAGIRAHHLIVISNCSWTMKVTQQR
jgi:hypothetical protein